MAKTKILRNGWRGVPNAFYVAAMRSTDERLARQPTENPQWRAQVDEFHQTFRALDDAYQRSQTSLEPKAIAELNAERDLYGQVLEQIAKQWSRLPDATLAVHGQRVYQVFKDISFRTSEALVAENEKITNMEQRFQEPQLQADLAAMGLTEVNRRFAALTAEICSLMRQRAEEKAQRVKGELVSAREVMDQKFEEFMEMTNALIVTGAAPELETLAAVLNADYKKIEEQIKQSKSQPRVMVKSDVVGNHRYAVPAFANWQIVVDQNDKAFALSTDGQNRILSVLPKASKAGGLYLTLGSVAVKPTDMVDPKKEYTLALLASEPEQNPIASESN